MNSDGDIYEGSPRSDEDVPLTASEAHELSRYNHATRRIVYSEMRRGKLVGEALEIALAKLPKK
jgi:hypothetical protein